MLPEEKQIPHLLPIAPLAVSTPRESNLVGPIEIRFAMSRPCIAAVRSLWCGRDRLDLARDPMKVIQLTTEAEEKALPILLRHSPGMVLPGRTYVLSLRSSWGSGLNSQ